MTRDEFAELLRRRIGLDPDTAGQGFLDAALGRRMAARGIRRNEVQSYFELVRTDGQELQSLIDEAVVPESWFFRDEVPFVVLAQHARRWWSESAGEGSTYRVLSMPCACGEEPYSAAISLLDAGLPPVAFHIDAVDVSERSLAVARRAVYSANAFRSGDLAYRDRHFHRTHQGYALDPRIAGMVEFQSANVASPAFLRQAESYNTIFCRNLMIYLDRAARETVLGHIQRLLGPDGLLIVGHAENPGLLGVDHRWVSVKGSFAFERSPQAATVSRPGSRVPSTPPAPALPARRGSSGQVARTIPPGRTRGTTPAESQGQRPGPTPHPGKVATPLSAVPSDAGLLEAASRLAGEGRNEEAVRLCEESFRTQGPTAPAYFLLGMIRQAGGDRAGAESCFEKAVYLDARHEEALLSLALLAQRRGDATAAANFARRAERAFQENRRP